MNYKILPKLTKNATKNEKEIQQNNTKEG